MRAPIAFALAFTLAALVPTAAARAVEPAAVGAVAVDRALDAADYGLFAGDHAFDGVVDPSVAAARAARFDAQAQVESLSPARFPRALQPSDARADAAHDAHCAAGAAGSAVARACDADDGLGAFAASVPVESERMAADSMSYAPAATEPIAAPAPSTPRETATPAARAAPVSTASAADAPAEARSGTSLAAAAAATIAGLALLPALLVLYRRISRSRLLDNATRACIFEFVKANPACSCAEVARAAGVHFTTAEEHLRLLASHGFVVLRHGPFGPAYFENGAVADASAVARAALLRQSENVAFLAAAGAHPGAGVSDLARTLGIAKSTASRRAAILRQAGLLPQKN